MLKLCSTSQRYKMKGNHNTLWYYNFQISIVFNKSKIQNERKSQPFSTSPLSKKNCVQQVKDTKWKEITTVLKKTITKQQLCSTSQRYKMKGNHNTFRFNELHCTIVFNKSKIQNERKSQLASTTIFNNSYCVQQVKDTKWKEITT